MIFTLEKKKFFYVKIFYLGVAFSQTSYRLVFASNMTTEKRITSYVLCISSMHAVF